jgi:hypothetical protein
MPKKQYYIHDNEVYEKVKNKFFSTYKQIDIPKQDTLVPEWHGKKIPCKMWREIVSFMVSSYKEFKSEALLFLYYDETKKQPWSYWVPPQITNGMTVKSDPLHPEFQTQRAQHPDIMFGTVHHHCTTSAFQSGTDSSDETDREGFHFTIGHCDKDTVDIHLRVTLGNIHMDIDNLSYIIDGTESPFKDGIELTDDMLAIAIDYINEDLGDTSKLPDMSWAEEFTNIQKPAYVKPPSIGSYHQYDMWGVKKKDDSPELSHIDNEMALDDFLDTFQFSTEIEDAMAEWILANEAESTRLITNLYNGDIDYEEYEKILHRLLTDDNYMGTDLGIKAKRFIEKGLDSLQTKDYTWTYDELLSRLSIHDEVRITI